MRRRTSSNPQSTDASLGPDALRPLPATPTSLPYLERVQLVDDWLQDRAAWVARRQAFAERNGWPGGDHARDREEDDAHPFPDVPFDAEWEIANGYL